MEKPKKKNIRRLITIFLVAVIISNTPPLQVLLLEKYAYQNKDGSFSYQEEPGRALDFEVCQIRWERFKSQNPQADHTLYREFTIKPWQFWEWWQFIAHSERFRLPYLSD